MGAADDGMNGRVGGMDRGLMNGSLPLASAAAGLCEDTHDENDGSARRTGMTGMPGLDSECDWLRMQREYV